MADMSEATCACVAAAFAAADAVSLRIRSAEAAFISPTQLRRHETRHLPLRSGKLINRSRGSAPS